MQRDSERERELKLDITDSWPSTTCEELVAAIAGCLGSRVTQVWAVERIFRYLDTVDRRLLKEGATLRCVEGFSPHQGDGKAAYRFDYKAGTVATDERVETQLWSDHELTPGAVAQRLLPSGYAGIEEVARCRTRHQKWMLESESFTVEASLDEFRSPRGSRLFRELELEIADGALSLDELRRQVFRVVTGLEEIDQQKYLRVMTVESAPRRERSGASTNNESQGACGR